MYYDPDHLSKSIQIGFSLEKAIENWVEHMYILKIYTIKIHKICHPSIWNFSLTPGPPNPLSNVIFCLLWPPYHYCPDPRSLCLSLVDSIPIPTGPVPRVYSWLGRSHLCWRIFLFFLNFFLYIYVGGGTLEARGSSPCGVLQGHLMCSLPMFGLYELARQKPQTTIIQYFTIAGIQSRLEVVKCY